MKACWSVDGRMRGTREYDSRRMLKKPASKAAAEKSTGGVTFSPARPELLAQFCPDGLR